MTVERSGTSYRQAVEFLYRLRWFGAKFGLENTFRLAALAGNPQCQLRFIHVAGTNGKGSTCAMLENVYRAAGLRVGLFTSPHLVSFRERIQVDRQWIAETDVVRLVIELQSLLKKFPEEHHPTFFETVAVMALRYFAERKCDLVIWETGLGGRLDATNIVTPLASVITNIQYDHQQWLGETLSSIAREKAGIIKARVPVITAVDDPEASAVVERIARDRNAPLTRVAMSAAEKTGAGSSPVALAGRHQLINAALARATVDVLQKELPVLATAVTAGMANVNWPGRLQLVERSTGQRILLDGAHNVAGAAVLAEFVRTRFGNEKATVIPGILADKDLAGMCELLAPLAARIFPVTVASERTASPEDLAVICRELNPAASVIPCSSLSDALAAAQSDSLVIIAGSLYLVGEAMELLGLCPALTTDERGLNEWSREKSRTTTRT